jgi:cysteine synthase A
LCAIVDSGAVEVVAGGRFLWEPINWRGIMGVGKNMTEVVGNTPVVQLTKVVPDEAADVFVKLEWFNPTGSYKDRMALAMIEEAEKRGDLRKGMTVVEYTSGSTGSSLAYVCAAKGYKFKVVSSDAFAVEKLKTMRAFGADLTIVPSDGGKITPELINKMIETASQYAAEPNTYWTNQLNNADSLVGYGHIGRELLDQMDRPIDVFCAMVGTAGLSMGVSAALADGGSDAQVVIFEPATSPFITTGSAGSHRVEGTGIGFMPPLLNNDRYGEARAIDESAGRSMARRLAAEEGLLAGTSTGLNVAGASDIALELGPGHTVVTVAVDTGLKYLAGDLYEM